MSDELITPLSAVLYRTLLLFEGVSSSMGDSTSMYWVAVESRARDLEWIEDRDCMEL